MTGAKRHFATIVLAIIALVFVVLGTLALTIWKPAQELRASYQPTEPYVMVREGVLPLYADSVTVTVEAESATDYVWVAAGSGRDVSAWLNGLTFDIVSGTVSATELAVEQKGPGASQQSGSEQSGSQQSGDEQSGITLLAEDEPAADQSGNEADDEQQSAEGEQSGAGPQSAEPPESPIQSDMWSRIDEGAGSVELNLSGDQLTDVLLIAADGKTPPAQVSLTWPTPTPNTLAWVFWPLAGLFLLAAIVWASVSALRRRSRRPKAEIAQTPKGAPADVETQEAGSEDQNVAADELSALASAEASSLEDVADEIESDEAPSSASEAERGDRKSVVVTTESGMLNLAAMQGGGQFPTRKALREARAKGVETLVVGARDFSTVDDPKRDPAKKSPTPVSEFAPDVSTESAAIALPPHLQWRSRRGAQRFGATATSESADSPATTGGPNNSGTPESTGDPDSASSSQSASSSKPDESPQSGEKK